MQDCCVQGIDRPRSIELGKSTRLELSPEIPQQDEGPGRGTRMLFVSVITGVDNECVVHHRSIALGNRFEGFHQFYQHAAVILANFMPDGIPFLCHVS